MRWWFCTASSPRSSTSNPKAAVLRRHRPKSGGTGISRFRRFCLIAVAAPSRASPDTGGRARPPPIRRSAAAPLPRRPVAPPPRRPAAARVRIQTSRSGSPRPNRSIRGRFRRENRTIPLFSETFLIRALLFNKIFQILQSGYARGRSPNPAIPTHYPATRSHFRHIRHTGTRHRESPGRYIP